VFIYKTTNLINGKIYIGKCSREKYTNKYLGSGIYLKRSIKKYGKENFSRETIEGNINSEELLNEREKYWIKFFDAKNPEVGYNLTDGGDGSLGCKKTEEAREKMRESWIGRVITEEWKQHMRENARDQRGEKNHMYGKIYSEEEKLEMSKNAKKGFDHPSFCTSVQGSSSKYIGVTIRNKEKKWRARIRFNSKTIEIGTFHTEIEAALAFNEIASELYGWKAKLNQISNEEIEEIWK